MGCRSHSNWAIGVEIEPLKLKLSRWELKLSHLSQQNCWVQSDLLQNNRRPKNHCNLQTHSKEWKPRALQIGLQKEVCAVCVGLQSIQKMCCAIVGQGPIDLPDWSKVCIPNWSKVCFSFGRFEEQKPHAFPPATSTPPMMIPMSVSVKS